MSVSAPRPSGADGLGRTIAANLGYPANRVTVTDLTGSAKLKARRDMIAAISISAEDGTFATVTVGITKRGSILRPELEEECERAVNDQTGRPGPRIRKISFGGDVYGYAGLGAVGPGGTNHRVIASSRSKDIDFQVAVSLPSEGIRRNDGTKEYHRLVSEGGLPLVDALVKAMQDIVTHVDQADLDERSEKPVSASDSVSSAAVQASEGLKEAPTAFRAGAASNTRLLLVAWALMAVVAVLIWFVAKRRP